MGPKRKPDQRRAACAQNGAAPSRGGVYRSRKPRARGACGHDYRLAFSCKRRDFCSRGHQQRVLA
jgi:hypothetical protein